MSLQDKLIGLSQLSRFWDKSYEILKDEINQSSSDTLTSAKEYTDQVKSDIYGGVPDATLDTLTELATAFNENKDVVDALNEAIVNKADAEHTHSYNDLTDKTHYDSRVFEECIIEWDGDTSDKLNIVDMFYKVSDTIPTNEQIENGIITMNDGMAIEISSIWSNLVQAGLVTDDSCVLLDAAIITRKDNVTIKTAGSVSITVNKAGVYFLHLEDAYTASLKYIKSSGEIKQLDEKFIPNTIARTSSVLSTANENSATASYSPVEDTDLVTKGYINILIATDDEILEMLTQHDMLPVVADADGSLLADDDGNILLW